MKNLGKDIFEALDGREFVNYQEFFQTISKEYQDRWLSFPVGYTCEELVRWGYKKGWIILNDPKITVRYS